MLNIEVERYYLFLYLYFFLGIRNVIAPIFSFFEKMKLISFEKLQTENVHNTNFKSSNEQINVKKNKEIQIQHFKNLKIFVN